MAGELLYRILSGRVRINLGTKDLILDRPSRESRFEAEAIYEKMLYEASMFGMLDEDEIVYMLLDSGLWSQQEAHELAQLEKDIDELKVKLYEYLFKSREREQGRQLLELARSRHHYLFGKRHAYDHLTPRGLALIARNHFLICSNLKLTSGEKLWKDKSFLEESFPELPEILDEVSRQRVDEKDFRLLARTDPWRSMWQIGKKEGQILGVSPIDYTDEERFLVSWSMIYDNVMESPNSPSQSVIEDDDMLDGWFILQRRARDNDLLRREGEDLLRNEKIKNSGEIFMPANTDEDAKRVDILNTESARLTKRSRMQDMTERGKVAEQDLMDTRKKIMMQYNQAYVDAVKARS